MPGGLIRKTREKIRTIPIFRKGSKKARTPAETSYMLEETQELYPTSTIENALKKFLETNAEELPVVEAGRKKFLGSLTPFDIFDYYGGGKKNNIFIKNKENMKSAANTPVRIIMQERPATVLKKDSIEKVIKMLRENNTVFVIHEGKLEGKVSDTSLLEAVKSLEVKKKVGSIMTEKIITATPGYTVKDACEIMVRNSIGAIPVTSENELVGIITKTDLMKYFSGQALEKTHESALEERIEFLMTRKVKTLRPEDSAEKALRTMLKTGHRTIPVKKGSIKGIISQKDIMKVIK